MVIGIDASRIRSGGAVAHIVGILNEFDYQGLEITEVHVWSYKLLLNKLPNNSWLKKHNPKATEKNILHQIFWQIFNLPKEFKKNQCNILFNIDAGTFCRIQPCVTLSQDLLSFEKGEMNRYGISLARLRLIILKYIQAYNLKKANGTIFLTKYAAKIVENFTGNILNKLIVPHGVSDLFFNESFVSNIPLSQLKEIKCIYVSNTAPYKHQWNVVKAIHQLKQKGYPVSLLLIGGGKGQAQKKN